MDGVGGVTSVETVEENFEGWVGLEEGFDEWEVEDFFEHGDVIVY